MVGIFIMFLVLFRNLTLSLIGVVPNFIAAFFILGIIGLLGNTLGYDDYYNCSYNDWYSSR